MEQPSRQLAPPRSLVHLDAARQRFGEQKVDLLIELTHTCDALMDAALQELETLGPEATSQLNHGICHGLQSIDSPPPALHAFLEEVERLPDWVDRERVRRGSEAYLSIGVVWSILALGPGSLTHTYSSPAIAHVLMQTGNLAKMALRRLIETGVWHIESLMPGGLVRGANGYVHTLQVRLLHARIRKTLLKRNWDQHAMGIPINQLDMTRTWLDFTYVPFRALRNFGITFTHQELNDLYHCWQYIAYLLGVDERVYREITNQERAQEMLELISSTEEHTNEDSQALMQGMLDAIANLLHWNLKLPVSFTFDLACAVTRRLHGNKLADQLGIPKTWVSALLPLLTAVNIVQRAWDHRSPSARQRAVAREIAGFQRSLAGNTAPTTYQRNADTPSQTQLPETREPQTASRETS